MVASRSDDGGVVAKHKARAKEVSRSGAKRIRQTARLLRVAARLAQN
jgi:hypothetical protein